MSIVIGAVETTVSGLNVGSLHLLFEVSVDAPPNLTFVAGDATKLTDTYSPESFDVVFSYWLLPHLSLDDPEPAFQAAKALYTITTPGGFVSIGPKASQRGLSLRAGPALQVFKDESIDADQFADSIVSETELHGRTRYMQRLANDVATPFFGTTRYSKRDGRIPNILHPESGEYVSPFTRKGILTVGKLAVALASHAAKQKLTK